MTGEVMAVSDATDNAQLIENCAQLGYLRESMFTLDMTYGLGRFWTRWAPDRLIGADLDRDRAREVVADFTRLPFPGRTFDAVVFDPPYKLNGTGGSHPSDAAYGVATPWRGDLHAWIGSGLDEAVRVLDGTLLVKCQDQVAGGKVRWQTREFADHVEALGLRLVDMMHLVGYRPQPPGRRQLHARRNYSTLMVFQ